jgi:hypothetical protein
MGSVFAWSEHIFAPLSRNSSSIKDMNTFAVLKTTKKRIHADECEDKVDKKYSKGYFSCIDCGNDVFVRRGKKKVWHFAHYCEDDSKKCPHANGGETKEHYDAKHFIARNIGKCAFAIERCPSCNRKRFFVGRNKGAPVYIHQCSAEVERGIPMTSRVADVAATCPYTGKCVAAIEVLHTHETDAEKRQECARAGVAVLEVTTAEVQRASAWQTRKAVFLQMTTTTMKNQTCTDCAIRSEWEKHVNEPFLYDENYNSAWERFYYSLHLQAVSSNRNRQRAFNQEAAVQEEYSAELEYSKWYEYMWDRHANITKCKWQINMLLKERSSYLKQGFSVVEKRKKLMASRHKRTYRGRSCITKCKGCSNWVFDDKPDEVCEVESDTMSKKDWHQLFKSDPKQYKKRYKKADGDYNSIYVHDTCSLACPACESDCLVQQLERYGLCFSCNKYFNDQTGRLEHKMKSWL